MSFGNWLEMVVEFSVRFGRRRFVSEELSLTNATHNKGLAFVWWRGCMGRLK